MRAVSNSAKMKYGVLFVTTSGQLIMPMSYAISWVMSEVSVYIITHR